MELLAGKILGLMLVLTRVGSFFAVSPVFSWEAIPQRIKISIAIFTAVFISSITSCPYTSENTSIMQIILLMSNEVIYGLALGYVTVMIFSAIKLGARIVERQMGLAMANILDPLSGEGGQPIGLLMEMIFILLFLSVNGHHLFLMTISDSYQNFPVGSVPAIRQLTEGIIVASSTLLLLGLKISAPILASFMLMMVVLAVMARIAPETNILFLSLPLRVGLGLLMVGIFLPFINNFIKEFSQWIDKLLPL